MTAWTVRTLALRWFSKTSPGNQWPTPGSNHTRSPVDHSSLFMDMAMASQSHEFLKITIFNSKWDGGYEICYVLYHTRNSLSGHAIVVHFWNHYFLNSVRYSFKVITALRQLLHSAGFARCSYRWKTFSLRAFPPMAIIGSVREICESGRWIRLLSND